MTRPSLITISMLMGCALAIVLLALCQSQADAGGTVLPPLPQWGPDTQVNPTPTDNPYHPLQLNPSLAVNPTNPNTVIAGWESFQSAPTVDAFQWSTNQGLTWSGGRFEGPWNPGAWCPMVTSRWASTGTERPTMSARRKAVISPAISFSPP